MYRVFNVLSDAVFFLKCGTRAKVRHNKAYSGIHEGQRCFIVATGPSLGKLPKDYLDMLRGEVVFGVNSYYKAPVVDGIVPTYYLLMDNNYWGVSSKTFQEVFEKYYDQPPVFITDVRAYNFVPEGAKAIPLYAKNYPVLKMHDRLDGNLSIAMNVVGFAILSAIYMGFKEIYLLGSDYNLFCYREENHCYDDKEEFSTLPTYNLAFYLKYYHLTTEFHYLLAKLARQKGRRVVNLSVGSLLDAYPVEDPCNVLCGSCNEGNE